MNGLNQLATVMALAATPKKKHTDSRKTYRRNSQAVYLGGEKKPIPKSQRRKHTRKTKKNSTLKKEVQHLLILQHPTELNADAIAAIVQAVEPFASVGRN